MPYIHLEQVGKPSPKEAKLLKITQSSGERRKKQNKKHKLPIVSPPPTLSTPLLPRVTTEYMHTEGILFFSLKPRGVPPATSKSLACRQGSAGQEEVYGYIWRDFLRSQIYMRENTSSDVSVFNATLLLDKHLLQGNIAI